MGADTIIATAKLPHGAGHREAEVVYMPACTVLSGVSDTHGTGAGT